jgi:adenine-specific DNA-methyltransferase
VFILRDQVGFDGSRLAAELRDIFGEMCRDCQEHSAYLYIINYMIFRISQDTDRKMDYSLPETGCVEKVLEKLRSTLDRSRYDFRIAAANNLLGGVYENFLGRETRKRLGLFYTPDSVIDFILENTLGKADVVENPYVKVLDPSCGSGYFLLKAYDILKKKFEDCEKELSQKYGEGTFGKNNIHRHIIENCIYGADIDEFGAMFTRISLAFKGIDSTWCIPNIVVCDSLVKWEKEPGGALVAFWGSEFDYIVGNPPWVSLTRKQGKTLPEEQLTYYRDNYSGNSYLPNLYEYFLQRSLDLVREGGSVGFLIPDRFAKNKQFAAFRKYILTNLSLKYIMFGISVEGVIADSMAIVIEKDFNPDNRTEVRSGSALFSNSQRRMLETEGSGFPSYSLENSRLMLENMMRGSLTLKQIAKSFTGFIGIKENIGSHRTNSTQISVVKGENIERYRIKGNKYYDISSENIIGGTKDPRKLLAKDKILVRKTGNRIVAALDSCGYAPEQSLYGIMIKNPDFSAKYVLAILNSRLMEEYYRGFLITNANSTPQLKKMDLDGIPIKNCPKEKQQQIGEIVDSLAGEYRQELQDELDRIICEIYG